MTALVPHSPSGRLPVVAPVAPPVVADEGLDLASLLDVVRRRFILFSTIFALVTAAAVALTLKQVPKYTASSAVMMDPRQIQVLRTSASPNVSGDLSLSTEAVATQVQVLQSRNMAEKVVDALRLDQDASLSSPSPGLRGRAVLAFQRFFNIAPKLALSPEERRQAVVDVVLSQLDIQRLGLTYVIGVKYTDPQRERAAVIANQFANSYIQLSVEGKSDATRQAGGYLNARLQELSNQAARDAAAVQQYKVANNILGARGATLTEQDVSNINGQIASARAEAAADQARLDTARGQLRRGSTGDDVGAALGSPVIQALRSQRAVVSGQLAELNSRYGPRYPDVIKAQQQLGDIDAQIRTEIGRVISNLQASTEVSAGRLKSLEGTLAQNRGTLVGNTRAEAGLITLQQKAAASQALYDSYLGRFKEVIASSGTEQSDARIVSSAQPPSTPSSPRVVLDLALGVIVAMVLGGAAVAVMELSDRSFATGADVERRLHIHYLGSVPLLRSVARKARRSPTDYVAANPFSVFAEGFRNIKVSILQTRLGTGAAVVAVTSPLTGEGKTTTSVCLGQTSAMQGARTVVVDCDLRRRTLQDFLGATPQAGLVEVIRGEAALDDVIVVDERTGLHFLPLADRRMTADDVFGGEEMDGVLAELRRRYDFVILDTAPLLALADARILASKCDAVVLLCRWRKTQQDALRSAVRLLETAGAPLSGVALTRVDVRKQTAYGYGDSTYYHREAQQYYAA